jgi:hypothetical protein
MTSVGHLIIFRNDFGDGYLAMALKWAISASLLLRAAMAATILSSISRL